MAMSDGDATSTSSIGPRNPPIIYKQYDDGFVVRSMTLDDAKIVQRWYGGMGHISIHDLDIALSVFPSHEGFYIGELDGVVIASAIRIAWGKNIMYGSLYFVHADYRRKGYGTRLRDDVARAQVGSRTLCIDAVMGKVAETNRKLGYENGFITARFLGIARSSYNVLTENLNVVEASSVSFDKIMKYDDQCFVVGMSSVRRRFMEKWLTIPHGRSFVAVDSNQKIVGLLCRRPCTESGYHMIGPLYAESTQVAKTMLQEACKDIVGHEFCINLWWDNDNARELADFFKMDHVFDTLRMHLNENPNELKTNVFALTSIDVCGF